MNVFGITLAPVFPLWLIIALFCLVLVSALVQFKRTREKLGKRRALVLSLLRLGAVSILVAFALNPSLVSIKDHWIVPSIAVLVDTSKSMGQSAAEPNKPVTRLDEAKSLLLEGDSPILKALTEKYEVNVYELTDSKRSLEASELGGLHAGGQTGNVNEALERLSENNALAVLLSDGNVIWDDTRTQSPPTMTIPVGNPDTYKDILIGGFKAPSLAFRDREVKLDVTIKNHGYAGLTLPVLLKESERLITADNVRITSDSAEVTTTLSFTPKEVGQKRLSISIPQQVGENILENNQINFSIKVVRDKTRILMVSGSPSMNYRFMRTALKSDPSVDLLSFVILRSPSDILNVPTHEMSLIPFPVETIFIKELNSFDLVIFDDFDYSLYLGPDHLESLRNFVKEEGHGFAIIGGPKLYHEGEYSLSPIEDMLPFRFVEKDIYRRDGSHPVRLSRAGIRHPIMRFSDQFQDDDAEASRFWRLMPPLDGINLIEAKNAATVLLQSADGVPYPILVVSEYGEGRVLTLATDDAWKWYMGLVARGEGNQPYLKLVHRMVRWLTKDPNLDPVQIVLPETMASAGQEIDVLVQFHGQDPSTESESVVSASVFNPEGLKIESRLKPTSQPNEQLVSFVPEKGGIYRITVETSYGKLEESMVVAGSLEGLDAAPDHERLKRIADSTGGQILLPGDNLLEEIEGHVRTGERHFTEETRLPIWATPFVMIMVLGLLASEWFLRRRWGLI
jgi:uncharacterized membrane protein